MGTGRPITCRECGDVGVEHASGGKCFKCFRREERLAATDPAVAAELLAAKKTKALKASQNKMRDAVVAMVKHLETIREHGHASGFLEDGSTVCDDLAKMLGPLWDKAKGVALPGPVLLPQRVAQNGVPRAKKA
jgi:hypothetical protein